MHFSEQIRETINMSQAEAIRLGNDFIGAEHLLLGLLRANRDESNWLKQLNVDIEQLLAEAECTVRGKVLRKTVNHEFSQSLPLSDQAEKVILGTVLEAKTRKSSQVDAHDLTVSIVRNNTSLDILDRVKRAIAS